MSSSARVPPLPGCLEALLGFGTAALGRLQPHLVRLVTTTPALGEAHPAGTVAGQGQEAGPGITSPRVRRYGERIEAHKLGHPGAFHEP
jgi:hypothetical protein